jgi:sigma-B regulation protein RsbU (phosphoserine phosphatase)
MFVPQSAVLENPISPTRFSTFPEVSRFRVLVADDQPDILLALRLLLARNGYQVETVNSPQTVLEALASGTFDVLLMDLNYARDTTSGREGMDLLDRLAHLENLPPIVAMTAWATLDLTIEGMRRGVGDFVLKPWDNRELLAILDHQIARGKRKRLERQDQAALREVQQGLLPKTMPAIPGCELSGVCLAASTVGGDYFDAVKLVDGQLGLCVGDVSGKGLPAALLMANLQAAVHAYADNGIEPRTLCQKVNHIICGNIAVDRFITFFYATLDVASHRLRYTNAGHNAPVLVHLDGSYERLETGGLVLGVDPKTGYEQGELDLAAGDRLVLFTDGVTEAVNAKGEEYGEQRLLHLLIESRHLGATALQEAVVDSVRRFSDGRLKDDSTVVVAAIP